MRCFCCDIPVEAPALDRQTGRYYCSECFQPTIEVILSQELKDLRNRLKDLPATELPQLLEQEDIEDVLEDLEDAFRGGYLNHNNEEQESGLPDESD